MKIIGIAGGSGSGKTTFAHKIRERVQDDRVSLLSQDSYYLAKHPESLVVDGENNYDHPDAFDWGLFEEHLRKFKAQETVHVPVYGYNEGRLADKFIKMDPCDVLLVEGIFTLYSKDIRKLFDLSVFLHVDADIRFIRRLHRDVADRGRTVENITHRYYQMVRPMHQKYLDPTRDYANIVVGEETDRAADVVSAQVKEWLK